MLFTAVHVHCYSVLRALMSGRTVPYQCSLFQSIHVYSVMYCACQVCVCIACLQYQHDYCSFDECSCAWNLLHIILTHPKIDQLHVSTKESHHVWKLWMLTVFNGVAVFKLPPSLRTTFCTVKRNPS